MTLFPIGLAVKAGIVALALAAGSVGAATPVMAQNNQNNPDFSFEFDFGPGEFRFGTDRDRDRGRRCVSDRRIVSEIREEGFRNVRIVEESRTRTIARATRGNWLYRVVVNCGGNIVDVDRLRRA